MSNIILSCMSIWFITCKLALNLDKMNIVKFVMNNSVQYSRSVYDEKHIEESVNTKFLYWKIDNHLNSKNHIDARIPKLCAACYVVMSLFYTSITDTLKNVFCSYSLCNKYRIIFGGNSLCSPKAFMLQKKIIRVMVGAKPRNACRLPF